jgi:Fe-S cluster assembly iron-binding protein IscA
MLTVTKKAADLLQVAKTAHGAPHDAGIRIRTGVRADESGTISVAFAVANEPHPHDHAFEQEGLRIFVEPALLEALYGRTLDVRDADEGPKLVFL